MRGKLAKQIRRVVRSTTVGESEAVTKREIKKAKKTLYRLRNRGTRSQAVTSGYFCCRVGRENTSGEPRKSG